MIRSVVAVVLGLPAAAVAGDNLACSLAESSCRDVPKSASVESQICNRAADLTAVNCPYVASARRSVTLRQALRAATDKLPTAAPVEVSYGSSGDDAWYEVEMLSGRQLNELRVCAKSGMAAEPQMIALAKQFVAADQIGQTEAPKLSMLDALRHVAAKHPHSQAVEAELELDDGRLVYEVRMLCGGSMKEVLLDAVGGKFLRCACDRRT